MLSFVRGLALNGVVSFLGNLVASAAKSSLGLVDESGKRARIGAGEIGDCARLGEELCMVKVRDEEPVASAVDSATNEPFDPTEIIWLSCEESFLATSVLTVDRTFCAMRDN